MNLLWNQKKPDSFEKALLVVDTTPFETTDPTSKGLKKLLYSYHYKMYCIKYLILVNRKTGQICYTSNGYAGSNHDLTIYRSQEIDSKIPPDVQLIADRIFCSLQDPQCNRIVIGYRDPKNDDQKLFNRLIAKERSIILLIVL